jgi:hypothetical protein
MIAVQVGYGERERRHTRLRNGARAERAVAIAEQHRHVAEAAPLNYVWYSIAIGISYRQPGVAVVRVVTPCEKGRCGGFRCLGDIGACQAHQKDHCGYGVSSHNALSGAKRPR